MFARDPLQLLSSLGFTSLIVLAILLGFSIISWGIILSKWRLLHLTKKEDRRFLDAYHEKVASGENDLRGLQRLARTLPHSPSGAVLLGIAGRVSRLVGDDDSDVARTDRTAGHWPDKDYVENVIRCLVHNQIIRQEAYLPFLATTGNLAPFIGLLGTVVGVINAFQQIGLQGTANIAAVAPGVSEALIATAAGLFAAIPAVIGYNYYLAMIRRIAFNVDAFGVELLNGLDEMIPGGTRSKRTR
ncbi:MAG: MotA/TolQ/ExbB proton channel family protein [Nitrospira sp.]|nr:MotA/TolQ/ExbB proton channel family protein [Nitrospira sp.]MDD9859371.1 MotA/TolQ/ExbB proton channel family protein [Nitrospira sp.]